MNGWLVVWLAEPERRPICQVSLHNEWIIDKEMIFNWIQIYSWTIVYLECELLKVGPSAKGLQSLRRWYMESTIFKRQFSDRCT